MKNAFKSELAAFLGPVVIKRPVEFNGKSRDFDFRVLSGTESEALFVRDPDAPKVTKGFRAKIIAGVVCDANGNAIFTAEEAGELPNQFQNVLSAICLDVNGLTDKAREEAGNVPSAGSSSGGPSSSAQDGSLAS